MSVIWPLYTVLHRLTDGDFLSGVVGKAALVIVVPRAVHVAACGSVVLLQLTASCAFDTATRLAGNASGSPQSACRGTAPWMAWRSSRSYPARGLAAARRWCWRASSAPARATMSSRRGTVLSFLAFLQLGGLVARAKCPAYCTVRSCCSRHDHPVLTEQRQGRSLNA